MDVENLIQKLLDGDIWLRHHTSPEKLAKIRRDHHLFANFTHIDETWEAPEDFRPIPAVYFQLVEGIHPHYGEDPYIVELYFSPEALRGREIILHPQGWHFGTTKTTPQYSTMKNLCNVSLGAAYRQIRYDFEGDVNMDELNEVMIIGDVSLDFLEATSQE